MATTLTMAAPAASPQAPRRESPVDLALSASFAPARYLVENPEQRERVRKFLRGDVRDASETFTLRGNVLKLSRRLSERLAAAEGGEEKGGGHRRARLALERAAGATIGEGSPAFPAGYYPDDFSLQTMPLWGLENDGSLPGSVAGVDINMSRVWEQFDGADTLVIAVLDAGYNFLHPDMQNRWFVNQAEANGVAGVDDDNNGYVDDVRGWDFVDADNDAQDYHGHGTQTSGVIAAGFDNGLGIAGMLPRVKILPLRVLSTAGFGNTADIAGGIRYAAAMGAHVVNFSIGIPGTGTDVAMRNAFLVARDSGMIISAASGNDHVNLDVTTTQPASYKFENIYMVGSHTHYAGLSGFSNYGATTVDITAPGEHIASPSIPEPLQLFRETFENFSAARWTFTDGTYQAAADNTLQGATSLQWTSGNTATAQLNDTLDLRGRHGGLLRFQLQFTPASSRDRLYIDAQKVGSTEWIEVGGTASPATGQSIAVNLGDVDDSRFRLRFQACVLNAAQTACSSTASTAGRVLRIDDVRIVYADLSPQNQAAYFLDNGGTSLAAPYFAGYAGLMRLATDRMGVPLTRARMLAGVVQEDSLAGKVITGGRLDAAKGLDFYLRTLPRISVTDTLHKNWAPGSSVAYSLTARDSTGPRNDFVFSAIAAPSGGSLGSTGLFTWNSSTVQGNYALRAKAVSGPITLRALVRFVLTTASPVEAAAPGRSSVLRIGDRAFVLPPAAFQGGTQTLRLAFYGSDGRTVRTTTGELAVPAGARSVEYRLSGFQGVGLRAWLNGTPLRAASDASK